ncbi:hypothetical protein D3C83_15460 [compost metagenome]
MVLRVVERGEVVPVGFYFRPVGDVEAERAPDRLDPLPGADHRVDAAAPPAAAGERDVERLLGEPRGELRVGKLGAPRLERRLDRLLGLVEPRPEGLSLFRRKRLETPLQRRQLSRLAEEARLGVLQGRGIARRAERGERARNDAVEVLQLSELRWL